MTRDEVQRWLDRYVEAWRTYDPALIGDLFSADATYCYHPYDETPLVGRDAIVADWVANPDAPSSWDAHYEPYAIDGDRVVATGESRYLKPDGSLRTVFFNVWTLRFDDEGRCREYVEWYMELPKARRGSA